MKKDTRSIQATVQVLIDRGFKKNWIRKYCGVTWETVNCWHLGEVMEIKSPIAARKLNELFKMMNPHKLPETIFAKKKK